MIISDCHLHTSFSADSDTPMEDMVNAAIDKGLKTICFTEHMDYEFPASSYGIDFTFDVDEYSKKINEIKNCYSDKIQVLKGIEIGLKPNLTVTYEKLLSDYDWDFVIGSTHLVGNVDPYYPEYWDNRTRKECFDMYFESMLKNVNIHNYFDTLGHLDYILRYAPDKNNAFDYNLYIDIIDEILKVIIKNEKGLEINSSGYKAGLPHPNPCKEIIKRFLELGGEIITIGSDSHTTEHIAYRFDSVKELLISLGIKYYAIYKNRKPEFIQL